MKEIPAIYLIWLIVGTNQDSLSTILCSEMLIMYGVWNLVQIIVVIWNSILSDSWRIITKHWVSPQQDNAMWTSWLISHELGTFHKHRLYHYHARIIWLNSHLMVQNTRLHGGASGTFTTSQWDHYALDNWWHAFRVQHVPYMVKFRDCWNLVLALKSISKLLFLPRS